MKKKYFLCIVFLIILLCSSCGKLAHTSYIRKYNGMLEWVENCDQLTGTMNSKLIEDSGYSKYRNIDIKINHKPKYIEYSEDINNDKQNYLLTEYDGKIYKTTLYENMMAERSFYKNSEELNNGPMNLAFSFNFKETKGKITKKDGYLVITNKYKSNNHDDYILELYSYFDIIVDEVKSSILTTKILITDDKFCFSNELIVDTNFLGRANRIDVKMDFEFKNESFESINLNDYTFFAPNRIEDVVGYTDINEYKILPNSQGAYYKYKLEKGYYYIKADKETESEIYWLISDVNRNKDNCPRLYHELDDNYEISNVFEIKKEDDYYLYFFHKDTGFSLCKYDISKIGNLNIVLGYETSHNDESIDYLKINYNFYKGDILCFENNGEVAITLLMEENNKSVTVNPNEKYYFVTKSNCCFIFLEYGKNIKFTLDTVIGDGYDYDYDDLELITDEPSKGFYISGFGVKGGRLRLEVTETTIYYFYQKTDADSAKFTYSVTGRNNINNGIIYSSGNKFILEKGSYIITINSANGEFAYGNVYYKSESFISKNDYYIEPKLTRLEFTNSYFPTITIYDKVENQENKYHFSVDRDCVIYFDRSLKLYDSNGRTSWRITDYILLKPGDYYFESTVSYGYFNKGVEIKCGIIDFIQTDFEVELEKINSLDYYDAPQFEHVNPNAYHLFNYWFNLDEDSILVFDYRNCLIYSQDGTLLNSSNEETLQLPAGRYYFKIDGNIEIVRIGIFDE